MASPLDRSRRVTLSEYMAMDEEEGYRIEVSRGYLVREPGPAPPHGALSARVIHQLMDFLDEHPGLGAVWAPVAFVLAEEPLGVRIPDVCFQRAPRPHPLYGSRLPRGAPDLAVEILSPANRAGEMRRRVAELLEGGTSEVWVLDPAHETVTVHPRTGPARVLRGTDRVENRELLPGFSWEVRTIFADS